MVEGFVTCHTFVLVSFLINTIVLSWLNKFVFHHWQYAENNELQEKINLLEQRLASSMEGKSSGSPEQGVPDEYIEELRKKVQSQVNSHLLGI